MIDLITRYVRIIDHEMNIVISKVNPWSATSYSHELAFGAERMSSVPGDVILPVK